MDAFVSTHNNCEGLQMKGPHKMTTRGTSRGVLLEDAIECVGPGWTPLIKEVYIEMLNYPGVQLVQVKEKFGRLRIYWDSPEATRDVGPSLIPFENFIRMTETKSGKMCELCGKEGKVMDEHGWLQARCREHRGHAI